MPRSSRNDNDLSPHTRGSRLPSIWNTVLKPVPVQRAGATGSDGRLDAHVRRADTVTTPMPQIATDVQADFSEPLCVNQRRHPRIHRSTACARGRGPGAGFPETSEYYPAPEIRAGNGGISPERCVDPRGRLSPGRTIEKKQWIDLRDSMDAALRWRAPARATIGLTTEDGPTVNSCYPSAAVSAEEITCGPLLPRSSPCRETRRTRSSVAKESRRI